MTTALSSVLADSATNATPAPLLLGFVAFGTLLLALFIVSRWNKDR
jgi:hypothetical protein